MTLITDELVTRIGRALDELPHNTPNRDKARAALSIAVVEITARCASIAANIGESPDYDRDIAECDQIASAIRALAREVT